MTDPVPTLRLTLAFAQRSLAPWMTHVPGVVLALYREASDVQARDVAGVLDVSKQYIAKLESTTVTIEAAGRYRAAVDLIAGEQSAEVVRAVYEGNGKTA